MNSANTRSESIVIKVLDGARHEHLPAIVDTLKLVFPNSAMSVDTFIWKHYENPQGASIVTYALDTASGVIAGARAFWRCDLAYQGKRVLAYQPCDTATHPDYRRYGLFRRMTELAVSEAEQAGAKLLFNFPNLQSKPAYFKLGWTETDEMIALLRPVHYGHLLLHALAGRDPARWKFTASTAPAAAQQWTSIEYPDAQSAQGPNDTFHSVRDEGFVNWRYRRHPSIRYGVVYAAGTTMVYRAGTRGSLKEVQIIEIIDRANRADPSVVRRLVEKVVDLERAHAVTAVLSRSNPTASVLSRAGFYKMPSKVTLAYRLLNAAREDQYVRSFSIYAGDLDTF